ncbi:ABC transporter permease [Priestia taiwanensis]|uniref:Peptide ABC transporter permease n=1 Tax=Priestia taiwanensis TaxID=1347902 RepID=A0A917AJ77_9BACI|nr:ABC transporter permease [Priestia taiwanensis]MBM7361773.1 peptide/nickel transport system permease protein [Priestia taiwanensis]GGE56886.1 peptide ABC transporter permease [Priestia taiwanensis]
MAAQVETVHTTMKVEKTPSGLSVAWREFRKDKLALGSLIFLILLLSTVYIWSFVLQQDRVTEVDLFAIHQPPSAQYWLGTDVGGRDIFGQLIIGTRNSFTIGLSVTLIISIFGMGLGLIAGYFGGSIDNIIMRFVDFMMILPFLMIVIVFVTIIPNYSVTTFVFIMSAFLWMGKARLIRSKVLAERELDYVQASKTFGTPHYKIIFREVLPNLSSIIVVSFTLSLAGNIGLESGLSYLGFGLPMTSPSLGTLINYASSPDVLQNKWWVWLPASVMILILMLSINFIGQALQRATDARQRKG